MATPTIEKFLPLTSGYINSVFEKDGRERGGHHNYVIEQLICNSNPCFDDMSKEEISEHDEQYLKYLCRLDGGDLGVNRL